MEGVSDAKPAPSAPAPLGPEHELAAFASGIAPLDEWLKRRARRNEAEGASRTFVACAGRRVVGYYSLAAASRSIRLGGAEDLGPTCSGTPCCVSSPPPGPSVRARSSCMRSRRTRRR